MERKLGLEPTLLAATDELLREALHGGAQLTRPELADALLQHGIEAEGLRLGYVLMHAELELLLCSGGLRGRQQTYALVDERVPRTARSRATRRSRSSRAATCGRAHRPPSATSRCGRA
jgi:hypothetical protein